MQKKKLEGSGGNFDWRYVCYMDEVAPADEWKTYMAGQILSDPWF